MHCVCALVIPKIIYAMTKIVALFLCLHCSVPVAFFFFMAILMDGNMILLYSQLLARFVNFIVYLQLKSVSNKIFSIFYRISGISDVIATTSVAARSWMQHSIAQCKMTFITSILVAFFSVPQACVQPKHPSLLSYDKMVLSFLCYYCPFFPFSFTAWMSITKIHCTDDNENNVILIQFPWVE